MPTDIKTDHFFFIRQKLLPVKFSHVRKRRVEIAFLFFSNQIKQAHLSDKIILFILYKPVYQSGIYKHLLFSGARQGIKRTCLDQIFDHALIDVKLTRSCDKIFQRFIVTVCCPLRNNAFDNRSAHAL